MTQNLDDVLDGKLLLSDSGKGLERPSYRRDGLYGATPFQPRDLPSIVALTIEQTCLNCGSAHQSFGGLFKEFEGTALQSEAVYRNAISSAQMSEIKHVKHLHEEVPYCPQCLGDLGSGATAPDKGGEAMSLKPLFTITAPPEHR